MALVCEATQPDVSRLQAAFHEAPVSEVLWTRRWCLQAQPSHLLRLRYSGPQWEQVGLLQYLAGFADSALTLPQATEQVLADLRERCERLESLLKRTLDSLRLLRGFDRAAHFAAGGTPGDWRGFHDIRPDRVKEGSRRACRRRVEHDEE
jgi:hypothetical protein